MASLAPGEIEQALLPYRIGRRAVSGVISEYIVSCEDLTDPFLLLSRLFIRLKSADSILEKIHRKNLAVSTVSDIGQVMDDLLGFRIITDNLEELWAFDRFLQADFDVQSRVDTINSPDQFGYRSIEYRLVYRGRNVEIPLEVQLRTQLQHYWASSSSALFHKAPPAKALEHVEVLTALSSTLAEAEHLTSQLAGKRKHQGPADRALANLRRLPLHSQTNLIVVGPGELFLQHERVPLSGDDLRDHQTIVERKLALYTEFQNVAIVEFSGMSFMSFALNEPQVKIPPERLDRIVW